MFFYQNKNFLNNLKSILDKLIPQNKKASMPTFSNAVNIATFAKKINKKKLIQIDNIIGVDHDSKIFRKIENLLEKELLIYYFSSSKVRKVILKKKNLVILNQKEILKFYNQNLKAIYRKI